MSNYKVNQQNKLLSDWYLNPFESCYGYWNEKDNLYKQRDFKQNKECCYNTCDIFYGDGNYPNITNYENKKVLGCKKYCDEVINIKENFIDTKREQKNNFNKIIVCFFIFYFFFFLFSFYLINKMTKKNNNNVAQGFLIAFFVLMLLGLIGLTIYLFMRMGHTVAPSTRSRSCTGEDEDQVCDIACGRAPSELGCTENEARAKMFKMGHEPACRSTPSCEWHPTPVHLPPANPN